MSVNVKHGVGADLDDLRWKNGEQVPNPYKGTVYLCNEEDPAYAQRFHSLPELLAFVVECLKAGSMAWPLDSLTPGNEALRKCAMRKPGEAVTLTDDEIRGLFDVLLMNTEEPGLLPSEQDD